MKKPIFNYDEVSDTLYVSFAPGEKATGIELNNQDSDICHPDSIFWRILQAVVVCEPRPTYYW